MLRNPEIVIAPAAWPAGAAWPGRIGPGSGMAKRPHGRCKLTSTSHFQPALAQRFPAPLPWQAKTGYHGINCEPHRVTTAFCSSTWMSMPRMCFLPFKMCCVRSQSNAFNGDRKNETTSTTFGWVLTLTPLWDFEALRTFQVSGP